MVTMESVFSLGYEGTHLIYIMRRGTSLTDTMRNTVFDGREEVNGDEVTPVVRTLELVRTGNLRKHEMEHLNLIMVINFANMG